MSFNNCLTKVRTNEREISSLLEYFSKRVHNTFEISSKVRTNEREISSLLEYFGNNLAVYSSL